jgi:MFS transporter, ACS family, glucarate transporter
MRTRYIVLLMLVLLSIITYMDRICIGVAAGAMRKELGISQEGWGWVIGAFLLAYGVFEIPTGALGDSLGQRKIITRIVVWWSAFTMLTGVARNFYVLVATRFFFGAGEAGAYPNASGVIGRWFPVGERGRAQGIVWGASRVGGALTPLVVVPLLQVLPWKAPFFLFGAIGLVWAVAWFLWFRDDPAEHPAMTPSELIEIGPTRTHAGHSGLPWGQLFGNPRLWHIMAMYGFYVFGAIFFMFSLTDYLTDGRHLDKYEAGICVSLAFAMGAIGNAVGGWASDHLSRRYGLFVGRNVVGTTSLALTGLLLLTTAFTPNKWVAAALLIVCFGVMDGMLPASWAICLDVGKRYAGAVSGAMNTAGQITGCLCMVLYGYMVKGFGSYDAPMPIFAACMFISAVLFALIDATRPLIPADEVAAIEKPKEPACV